MLSVIIPAYNEEKMIPIAAERISGVLDDAGIDHELIFVDDGSTDGSWEAISALASGEDAGAPWLAGSEKRPVVRGVRFSRNFGKEAAMFAGLEAARGDAVAVMDCDLQHPAEKLPEMYALWQEGYEVVEGIKSDRGSESRGHRAFSRLFYRLISSGSGFNMSDSSDFKLLDRKVVDTLNSLPEKNAFFRALSFWSGYRRTSVTYAVARRTVGHSKWNTRSLVKYAVSNITSFTAAPLHIITWLGALTFLVSLVMGIIAIVQKISGRAVEGFTTVILLILLIGSLIMLSLGIIGIYISKIYDEVKGRPRYVVSETCGEEIK